MLLLIPVAAGAVALCFALYFALFIRNQSVGTERMAKISSAIAKGARAFLFAEYKILHDYFASSGCSNAVLFTSV